MTRQSTSYIYGGIVVALLLGLGIYVFGSPTTSKQAINFGALALIAIGCITYGSVLRIAEVASSKPVPPLKQREIAVGRVYPDPRTGVWASDFTFTLSRGQFLEPRLDLRASSSTGRIDDFYPHIMLYRSRDEQSGAESFDISVPGDAFRTSSILQFAIKANRANSLAGNLSRLEEVIPELKDHSAGFFVALLQSMASRQKWWIDILGSMPGRHDVPIDLLQIILSEDDAVALPEEVTSDLVWMDDGRLLVAQAPL